MIERNLLSELRKWKDSARRKPLVLRGVRQCGKTWLLKEFGRRCFKDTAYFSFERNQRLHSVFDRDEDPKRILAELELLGGAKIEPQTTLIVFDEIQSCPRAMNSLKYFCEEAPEYAVAAAGSLLGITLASPEGFPVGKVNFLELHPCSFDEYLAAAAPQLAKYAKNLDRAEPVSQAIADELERELRRYLVLGGMPEVLSACLADGDFAAAEQIQDEILDSYELDFSKHAPKSDVAKLFLLWKSIPRQLARENAKFVYGEVKSGSRARDLEDALRWLQEAGLVDKIDRIERPAVPLSAYEDRKSFKVYLADTGLLRRLAGVPADEIMLGGDLFGEFKGRLAENFVLQSLAASGFREVFYWTSGNTAEVDFVIPHAGAAVPLEVKSGLNVRARSLKVYREKYSPQLAVRCSMQNLRIDDGVLNLPLWLLPFGWKFLTAKQVLDFAGSAG